jgi:hypothetical protein
MNNLEVFWSLNDYSCSGINKKENGASNPIQYVNLTLLPSL